MKKLLSGLILGFLGLLMYISPILADNPTIPNPFGTSYDNALRFIIASLFNITVVVVVLTFLGMIVYAGFLVMTGGSNKDNIEHARKIFLYATIGIGSFSFVFLFIKLIEQLFQVNIGFNFLI